MHSEKIEFAKRLYLKYNGRHHIRIESEMRALGYQNFSRRSFYTRHKNGRKIEGWIDRFKWRSLLSVPPAIAGGVLINSPSGDGGGPLSAADQRRSRRSRRKHDR